MATPLFYVNLAEDARDYRHTALEPGLPLLDRQGVNFLILRKWLGDYVAEPEWRNESVVAFYMAEDERGRLENTDCSTVSKAELEKQFAPDLDAIRSKIKKAKAESSTESMVLRILKKTIAEQTNDLENSDFDSYFFKCRAAEEPWRLVWCCGYQRADLEPLRGRIWHTPDGDFLGVRPPDGGRVKRRKRKGPLAILMHPAVWLLLLLLLGGFAYATWPTLVVTPADWSGPMGSRITYKVEDHRWFFFKNNVTSRVVAQSTDPRVVEFDPHGAVANAKSEGRAAITFLAGNRAAQAMVDVTPLTPPDSLVLEPADKVKLGVGEMKQLKAIGHYNDGRSVDLTSQVDWWEEGDKRLLAMHDTKKGMVEATSAGATKVVARYPMPIDKAKDTYAETSIAVDVSQAKYKTLEVSLDPFKFRVNESSRIEVQGIDENGEKHLLTGSSLLKFKVDPTTVASVDEGYLVGHAEEKGTLKVAYADLDKAVAFTVKGRMKIKFNVQPTESEAIPTELLGLNVTVGNNDPIEAQSSDPSVVEVWSTATENAGFEVFLAARDVGEADITVSQHGESKTVKVTVVEGQIKSLEFAPPVVIMDVGHPEFANLRGTTEDGRVIHVVPDVLRWEKQPLVENVSLDQRTLLMRPLLATTFPQDLQVRLADTSLVAEGTVEVRGSMDVATIRGLDEVDVWGVHPPVAGRGKYINGGGYLGDDTLVFDRDRGGLLVDHVDADSPIRALVGSTITDLNGRSLAGMTEAELGDYLRLHPPGEGDLIKYVGADGLEHTSFLGGARAIRDFKLLDVNTVNVGADGLNAEVQAYLRLADDYRLVDKDGKALSDWKPYPADATPVMISTTKIPRNASEDYEIYVERKDGKRFQVTFRLGSEGSSVIEKVPRRVIETDGDVLERAIGIPESKLKSSSTTTRIRETVREVPRDVRTTSTTTVRDRVTTLPAGSGTRSSSTTVSSSAPAGSGSGTRSPSATSPATSPASAPASPSAAPKTPPAKPAPSKPDDSPSKPDDSPAKPDPSKPDPAKPDSAPPKPSPAKPSPAKPSPAKPSPDKPSPDDAQPSPDDEDEPDDGSDSRSPDNVAPATPTGSGTRGTPTEPDAYGSGTRRPFGSATRAGANVPAGSATRGTSGLVRRAPERNPKKSSEDGEEKKGAKTLDALKKYNRDWQADKPK